MTAGSHHSVVSEDTGLGREVYYRYKYPSNSIHTFVVSKVEYTRIISSMIKSSRKALLLARSLSLDGLSKQ